MNTSQLENEITRERNILVVLLLNVDRIPTRLGYVVRCSDLEAQYVNDQAYIRDNGSYIKLEKMTAETQEELRFLLRRKYLREEHSIWKNSFQYEYRRL